MADLLDKEIFEERLKANLKAKNEEFVKVYDSTPMNFDDIFEEYYQYGQQLKQYVCDTSIVLNDAIDKGEHVLFEGAQGIMLDIDQGTYPFVTSSNPAGGVTVGAGVGASRLIGLWGLRKLTPPALATVRSQLNCSIKPEISFAMLATNSVL